ncbi:MAG: CHAD domain-containing protein [Phycisphaerae bacterium]
MHRLSRNGAGQEIAGLYERFSMDRAHAEHVAGLCGRIFADLPHLHGLTKTCRGLVEAAALLHDIDEAPKEHHDARGARRIRAIDLPWLPAHWKPIVATAVGLHSARSDVAGFLRRLKKEPTAELELAGRVAAILRLGDGLDHCRRQDTDIAAIIDDGRAVTIYLGPSPSASENAAFAMGKADLWNRIALRPVRAIAVAQGLAPNTAWLRPWQPIAVVLREIIQRQLEQVTSREYGLGYEHDLEFVHEMRVAMRRMHSAIQAFGKRLGGLKKPDRQVHRIGKLLGSVRDSDVLLEHLEGYAGGAPPSHQRVLSRVILQRRELRRRQHAEVMAAMASAKWRNAKARLGRIVQAQADERDVALAGKSAGPPARREARRSLLRQLERVWGYGRSIEKLSPRRQHRLRIECKKLRYLAEFFEGFYGPWFGGLIRTATRLQDLLGMAHDSSVYAQWLKDVAGPPAGKGGAAVERLMEHLRRRRRECLDKAGRIWRQFRSRRSRNRLVRLIDSPRTA